MAPHPFFPAAPCFTSSHNPIFPQRQRGVTTHLGQGGQTCVLAEPGEAAEGRAGQAVLSALPWRGQPRPALQEPCGTASSPWIWDEAGICQASLDCLTAPPPTRADGFSGLVKLTNKEERELEKYNKEQSNTLSSKPSAPSPKF